MSNNEESLRAALELSKRLPSRDVTKVVQGLCTLRPDLTEDILQRIDTPLKVQTCASSGRKYLLCDYNRDGDSYRSPYSSLYDPPIEGDEGVQPSPSVRALEVAANEAFESYREAYYPGDSAGSVYMWDAANDSFAACWLVKRTIVGGSNGDGSWDATHVFSISVDKGSQTASYKLTTTVLLALNVDREGSCGSVDLSGSLIRQSSSTGLSLAADRGGHVANMGAMVEAMENDMRSSLESLYISKTREIVSSLRPRNASIGINNMSSPVGGMRLPGLLSSPSSGGGVMGDLAAALSRRAVVE